mmetsp:Transcript_9970/g.29426  ORF Transcript_9970/g.29426 Transcript_9970/m.29426 type:complete len:269 (-) Transcript_9970:1799-2605(-)
MPDFAAKTRDLADVLADREFDDLDEAKAQRGDEAQVKLLHKITSRLATARVDEGTKRSDLERLARLTQLAMEAQAALAEEREEAVHKLEAAAEVSKGDIGAELQEAKDDLEAEKEKSKKSRKEVTALQEQLREKEEELREKVEEVEDTRGILRREVTVTSGGGGRQADQMREQISSLQEDLRAAQVRPPRRARHGMDAGGHVACWRAALPARNRHRAIEGIRAPALPHARPVLSCAAYAWRPPSPPPRSSHRSCAGGKEAPAGQGLGL